MRRWPVHLLLKLLAEPRGSTGGAAATAKAFLPSCDDAPAIVVDASAISSPTDPAPARSARRPFSRRRLPS
jgi:hypothetical protein